MAGIRGGVMLLALLLGALVLLVLADKSTDDLFRLLNTALNATGVLTGTGSAVLASRAWRASRTAAGASSHAAVAANSAAQRLDGDLDQRIIDGAYAAVHAAMRGTRPPEAPPHDPSAPAPPDRQGDEL